ncbi:hypothetical protein HJG60_009915 [Phyllostomus discolor]|uniref:Uncharacterized protein n=1 Tax=Phyllostomus discolor TaxID=89673 RepID=A0A834BCX4_9CHIR|nr:hypothetical protein HJG60_009915 [Phyllostomus discolor]
MIIYMLVASSAMGKSNSRNKSTLFWKSFSQSYIFNLLLNISTWMSQSYQKATCPKLNVSCPSLLLRAKLPKYFLNSCSFVFLIKKNIQIKSKLRGPNHFKYLLLSKKAIISDGCRRELKLNGVNSILILIKLKQFNKVQLKY